MNTRRMRTRDKAIEQLRQDDPGTSFTRNALDFLINEGKIPTVKTGNKVLLDYDTMLDVLSGDTVNAPQDEPQRFTGAVRKIEV